MTDIEIPYENDRHGWYRVFEVLPGALSWLVLLLPVGLSFVTVTINDNNVNLGVVFILAYILVYFVRSIGYSVRAVQGYRTMQIHKQLNWRAMLADIEAGSPTNEDIIRPKWHISNLARRPNFTRVYNPSELVHAVIIATVNESREVLEPTIQSVLDNDFDPQQLILVLAYEGRAGQEAESRVQELVRLYGPRFKHAMAVKHPANIAGEIVGKGSNITYGGRELQRYLEKKKIDPANVIVTTLDADNRPDRQYFAAVSYLFCMVPEPLKASYQPLPMFTNNIWDAPTLMRVIATGNTLFYIVGTQRPHRARNFSAHAQSMQALIDMDFWSVRTIVEDGHHFWRSYFHFDGDYRVYPLSIPVYQDAVLADGYLKTMRAQFIQLRRWTYGASDVAYVAYKGFFTKNKAWKPDILAKFLVLLEGHITWATGTILVLAASRVPVLIAPQSVGAIQLPGLVSAVQTIGITGLLVSVYVCMVTLPPRPARYKRHRSVLMMVQWVLAPISAVCFGSLAAFNSQTRLMFKRYLSKFDVTEKARVAESGERISTEADPGQN
ncbi:MAG TPA: hypothetical protein VFN56_02230 [Candidatus Saccharimonadales bacterium]|nr:hypothetical protein [Candidatus Saccharimonadales bacterium]